MADLVSYEWLVYAHIFGVFVFLIAHGVSAGVGFRLARERNRERVAGVTEVTIRNRCKELTDRLGMRIERSRTSDTVGLITF